MKSKVVKLNLNALTPAGLAFLYNMTQDSEDKSAIFEELVDISESIIKSNEMVNIAGEHFRQAAKEM